MYGRRRNLKVLLHLGLGGRASVDSSVVIDEGQVLALFGGIGFLHLHPYNEAHGLAIVSDLDNSSREQASRDFNEIFLRVEAPSPATPNNRVDDRASPAGLR